MNFKNLYNSLILYIAFLVDVRECNNWMYLGISSLGTSFPYNRFSYPRSYGESWLSNASIGSRDSLLKSQQRVVDQLEDHSYYSQGRALEEERSPKERKDKFKPAIDNSQSRQYQRLPSLLDGAKVGRLDQTRTGFNTLQNSHNTQHKIPLSSDDRSKDVCKESFRDRLVSTQLQVCQSHPESLVCVSQGARMAIAECQRQFRNERWNCSAAVIQTVPIRRKGMTRMLRVRNFRRRRIGGERQKRRLRNIENPKSFHDPPVEMYDGGYKREDLTSDKYYDAGLGGNAKLKVINVLSKTLEKGTKESAFIYATASAAVVHAVTQSCSAGNLTDCSCRVVGEVEKSIYNTDIDSLDKGEWKWGGCSDNVDYGIKFSREFVDAPDNEQIMAILNYYGYSIINDDSVNYSVSVINSSTSHAPYLNLKTFASQHRIKFGKPGPQKPTFSFPYTRLNKQIVRHLINLHNNEMGRKAIESLIQKQCRCHGVSGSCELKTCWLNMPPFANIGSYIKSKYHESVRVLPKLGIKPKLELPDTMIDDRDYRKLATDPPDLSNLITNNLYLKARTKNLNQMSGLIKNDQLAHMDKSPNYCRTRPESGVFGTRGRLCNATSTGTDGCTSLCCGRGFERHVNIREERCHCKFVWCCYVNCNTCKTIDYTYTCK